MRNQTYPVQNKNDTQCWCSTRGKSASESSDRGDSNTYKLKFKHYRFSVIVKVPFPKNPNSCCSNIRHSECTIHSSSGLHRRGWSKGTLFFDLFVDTSVKRYFWCARAGSTHYNPLLLFNPKRTNETKQNLWEKYKKLGIKREESKLEDVTLQVGVGFQFCLFFTPVVLPKGQALVSE